MHNINIFFVSKYLFIQYLIKSVCIIYISHYWSYIVSYNHIVTFTKPIIKNKNCQWLQQSRAIVTIVWAEREKTLTYTYCLVILYSSKTYVTSCVTGFKRHSNVFSSLYSFKFSDPLALAWCMKNCFTRGYYISVVVMCTANFQDIDVYFSNSSSFWTKLLYTNLPSSFSKTHSAGQPKKVIF